MSIYRIQHASEGFIKDRGSKFLAFAFPVSSVEDIDGHMQLLRKKYHDARHHCSAYRLGNKGQTVYTNDDGEPSNSAGMPILAAIRSLEVTDVLVVVVRYFGGTKLGVRGLIEAYRSAAEDALQQNEREEIIAKVVFSLMYPYEKTSDINRLLHPHPVEEVESSYTDICKQTFSIKKEDFPPVASSFESAGIPIKVISIDD